MNQTFSFSRWWMLVTRHWAENRRRYLLSLLAVAGLLVIWNGFNLLMQRDFPMTYRHQLVTYFIGLFLTGCIFASTIFAPLGNKKEAIQYLAVAASQLEKFLCALLYAVFLFFIAYTIIFYLTDIPSVRLSQRLTGVLGRIRIHRTGGEDGIVNVFAANGLVIDDGDTLPFFLLAFFAVQSVFILGSIYFSRWSFIKTVVAVLLLILVGALFMVKVISANIPHGWNLGGFLEWHRYTVDGLSESVTPAAWFMSTLSFVGKYTLPLICWFIAYVRLKEKEV